MTDIVVGDIKEGLLPTATIAPIDQKKAVSDHKAVRCEERRGTKETKVTHGAVVGDRYLHKFSLLVVHPLTHLTPTPMVI